MTHNVSSFAHSFIGLDNSLFCCFTDTITNNTIVICYIMGLGHNPVQLAG